MTKIIIHTSQEPLYKSLVRPLFFQSEFETLSIDVHQRLMDICHKIKPNVVFLPASEYTQEFNDFIVDNHTKTKIVIVLNVMIPEDKQEIIRFWQKCNVLIIGSHTICQNITNELDNNLIFDRLYDSYVYKKDNHIQKTKKVAVLLSNNSVINDELRSCLYPNVINKKIVLFNNPKFIHIQNLGLLSEADLSLIMNSYEAIVDLDNRYELEAQVCGIPNIETTGNLKENIESQKTKSTKYNEIDNLSYDYYITNILSSRLRNT